MDTHARRPLCVRASRSIVLASLAVALAGSLSGCAHHAVHYTPLFAPPHPLAPRPVEKVELYLATPPARPHVDVGMLQVEMYAFPNDKTAPAIVQQMFALLKQKAAQVGCDAVLVTSIDRHASRHHSPSVQASCVVYNDAAPPA
jgi:hypothetical protein